MYTSSGRNAKNRESTVHPRDRCGIRFQVDIINSGRSIGLMGPNIVLKLAHPYPENALIINCIAQHEELSSGSTNADILDWWQDDIPTPLKLFLSAMSSMLLYRIVLAAAFFQKCGDQIR